MSITKGSTVPKILHKLVIFRPLLTLLGVKPDSVVGRVEDVAEVLDKIEHPPPDEQKP